MIVQIWYGLRSKTIWIAPFTGPGTPLDTAPINCPCTLSPMLERFLRVNLHQSLTRDPLKTLLSESTKLFMKGGDEQGGEPTTLGAYHERPYLEIFLL